MEHNFFASHFQTLNYNQIYICLKSRDFFKLNSTFEQMFNLEKINRR